MKDIRSILRLTHESGLSVREVSERLGLSKSTVSTYLLRAREAGLDGWQMPEGCGDDAALERRLFRQMGRPPRDTTEPVQKRGRRRPDPLVGVTDQLKTWFLEEPWRSARDLLEKLQAESPGDYPERLLRTVQRRLKGWRSEQARALVFSSNSAVASEGTAGAAAMTDGA
jgi:hypothetical protein